MDFHGHNYIIVYKEKYTMDKQNKGTAKRVILSLLLASALGGCAAYPPARGNVDSSVRVDYGYHDGYYYDRYGYRDDNYRYRRDRRDNYSTRGSVGVNSPGVSVGIGR
jgi:hypothetical protein